MGRDADLTAAKGKIDISTHTPAWGATNSSLALAKMIKISTHTPAWGATAQTAESLRETKISTHTPAWGATIRLLRYRNAKRFQLTRPRGARHPHMKN